MEKETVSRESLQIAIESNCVKVCRDNKIAASKQAGRNGMAKPGKVTFKGAC